MLFCSILTPFVCGEQPHNSFTGKPEIIWWCVSSQFPLLSTSAHPFIFLSVSEMGCLSFSLSYSGIPRSPGISISVIPHLLHFLSSALHCLSQVSTARPPKNLENKNLSLPANPKVRGWPFCLHRLPFEITFKDILDVYFNRILCQWGKTKWEHTVLPPSLQHPWLPKSISKSEWLFLHCLLHLSVFAVYFCSALLLPGPGLSHLKPEILFKLSTNLSNLRPCTSSWQVNLCKIVLWPCHTFASTIGLALYHIQNNIQNLTFHLQSVHTFLSNLISLKAQVYLQLIITETPSHVFMPLFSVHAITGLVSPLKWIFLIVYTLKMHIFF